MIANYFSALFWQFCSKLLQVHPEVGHDLLTDQEVGHIVHKEAGMCILLNTVYNIFCIFGLADFGH